jgi:hypothetical protein
MKKSSRKELNWEETEKLMTLALEERNPFEIIKKEFGLVECLQKNSKCGKRKQRPTNQNQNL